MSNFTSNIDWDFITDAIKDEKCILFIGPEIFKNEKDEGLEVQIAEFLEVKENKNVQHFHKQDGLFLFASNGDKALVSNKIKQFYRQDFRQVNEVVSKLAQIPFSLIISLTPDHQDEIIFKEKGYRVRHYYYWKDQVEDYQVEPPTSENPIIYNLFGSVEHPESMVLTHDDLFVYFKSIMAGIPLPNGIRTKIKSASNLIFLGIDFEKWYMQLLLRILNLHEDSFGFVRYAANQSLTDEVKVFCAKQFTIEFVPNNINSFLTELETQCQRKEMLKAVGTTPERIVVDKTIFPQLRKLLEMNKIEDFIEGLKGFLEKMGKKGMSLLNELTKIANRHHRLQLRMRSGVISYAEAEIIENKIIESLIDLLNDAAKLE